MGHIDVCPKDVWIKRALIVFYSGDFPDCAKEYAGIAQQYLFYYARETKLKIITTRQGRNA
jgi:N-glycosylase/DNA lyase